MPVGLKDHVLEEGSESGGKMASTAAGKQRIPKVAKVGKGESRGAREQGRAREQGKSEALCLLLACFGAGPAELASRGCASDKACASASLSEQFCYAGVALLSVVKLTRQ